MLFFLVLGAGAASACDVIGGGPSIRLDSADVRLEPGAEVHAITVSGTGALDSLSATAVRAEQGDAIRFIAGDHRTHAFAFDADALDAAAREFLERTTQLRGPPLVSRGSEWVVSLEGAPAGRYPFLCRSHGVSGVVEVGERG